MDSSGYNQLYATLLLHGEIPEVEFEKFIPLLAPKNIIKDNFFIQIGEMPKTFGFIMSGIFKTYYLSEEGNEIITDFCMEKEISGSVNLFDNCYAEQSIQAIEDSFLYVVNYKAFLAFSERHICWQKYIRNLMDSYYSHKTQKEKGFLMYDAEARYLNFLKEHPGIENRVYQYQIASYLGITPIALSRIRKKIQLK